MPDIDDDGVIDNVDGPQNDAVQAEEKDVEALTAEYKAARKFDKDAFEQYAIDRSYAAGKSKNWASDANLIGTFIDILVSFMYARDPDVSAKAAKNIGGVRQDAVDFAETAGIVVSRLWKKARLKRSVRKLVRSAYSVGPGWLKVIMTHETKNDPVVQKDLNDIQENIEQLEFVQRQLSDPEESGDFTEDETSVKLSELRRQQENLQNKLEVIHRSGLAIDYVRGEDMQVSLDVADLGDHLDADWNANRIYLQKDSARARFKRLTAKDMQSAVCYNQVKPKKRDALAPDPFENATKETARFQRATEGSDQNAVEFVCVVELWDKRDNHIKTFIEGVKRWAREPYPPNYVTSRFQPYFNLALFEVDGERHPQSLSYRLAKLQNEYSSKRSNSKLASERSVPGVIFDNTGVSPEDARKIEGSVSMEYVGIKPAKGDDIRKLFAEKPVPKIDPLVFDTRATISDMERVSGVQEALSATVTRAKTATEAKIQDAGFNSRSSADRDTLEDLLSDLAEYSLELAIQGVSAEQAARLAGPGAFWPVELDVESLTTLAEIEIKAGSTGKPDEEEMRQSWSIVLPLIQAIMREIQQAQLIGNIPMAVALKNLLLETFRRLDERIDVEKFIPAGDPESFLPILEQIQGANSSTGAPGKPAQTSADANTLV